MARRLLKGVAWLLGAVVVLLAAWFGINATDEALSEEARAALAFPPPPPPSRDNGHIDFLALDAPEGIDAYEAGLERLNAFNHSKDGKITPAPWESTSVDARLRRCVFGAVAPDSSGVPPCLDAAAEPGVRESLERHGVFLRRYRAMREKPRFVSLLQPRAPEDPLPAYQTMLDGQRLITLGAGLRFNAGDRDGAVRELESDIAFYRKMLRDSTTLLEKMIAVAAQDRAAMFVVELARRMPRGNAALWTRLESLVRPLAKEDLDISPALHRDTGQIIRMMQPRHHVQISDALYESFKSFAPGTLDSRRRWNPIAPYLYRPNQTANWYAARCRIYLEVGQHPSTEFNSAVQAAHARAELLDPGPLMRVVVNPMGWGHEVFKGCEDAGYVARIHSREGIQTLARLIVKLRAAGITRPEAVTGALAGPLGQAHPDPFTGKPMRFDPSSGTIGFDIQERYLSGAVRGWRFRYGRMALQI